MNLRIAAAFCVQLLVCSCADKSQKTTGAPPAQQAAIEAVTNQNGIKTETLNLFDNARNRAVPVVLYSAGTGAAVPAGKPKLAILNHGYGMKNTGYTFVAYNIVAQGYTVASIQHQLPSDAPLPTTGNVRQVRMPSWEQGVQNMQFVLRELKQTTPDLDFKNVLLIGHSHGGDMAMLFAQKYPNQVQHLISLDHRRVAMPRTRKPRILSFRSSDQVADDGVLPTAAEQKKLGIQIVQMKNLTHNDIWDGATDEKKREVNQKINAFLKAK